MRDPWSESDLVRKFRELAESSLPRAPLNAELARTIASAPSLSSMLGSAPVNQQSPVLMLAAIHFLVLAEPDSDLAEWYPNLTSDHRAAADPALRTTLQAFVEERAPSMFQLLTTRRTQTNEVGRCGVLLPPMSVIADEVGGPLVHVDVGTSGGLNLLLPRFAYRYGDRPTIGASEVLLEVGVRGGGPTPEEIPPVASSVGLDSAPIDVTDPIEARWLEACCWPDQADRFHRLRSAIELAAVHPPEIVDADAVTGVATVIGDRRDLGHPVVTTTWVMSYLSGEQRHEFLAELELVGAELDLSWIAAESPAQTPELPHHPDLAGEHLTELTLTSWRAGERSVEHLGTCHPHGYWIHWR
ncbi:MAG: DUF2332 domain-containing protein [Ilumatobacter sp.]